MKYKKKLQRSNKKCWERQSQQREIQTQRCSHSCKKMYVTLAAKEKGRINQNLLLKPKSINEKDDGKAAAKFSLGYLDKNLGSTT